MDRREMMEIVASTIGAIKVKADISTIDATPKPLLIVVTIDDCTISEEDIAKCMTQVTTYISETAGYKIPFLITRKGVSIKAVIDPREEAES